MLILDVGNLDEHNHLNCNNFLLALYIQLNPVSIFNLSNDRLLFLASSRNFSNHSEDSTPYIVNDLFHIQ